MKKTLYIAILLSVLISSKAIYCETEVPLQKKITALSLDSYMELRTQHAKLVENYPKFVEVYEKLSLDNRSVESDLLGKIDNYIGNNLITIWINKDIIILYKMIKDEHKKIFLQSNIQRNKELIKKFKSDLASIYALSEHIMAKDAVKYIQDSAIILESIIETHKKYNNIASEYINKN
ncbi:hypothetical protein ACFL6B_04100 [Thermodesulfobacteriota bacterium]